MQLSMVPVEQITSPKSKSTARKKQRSYYSLGRIFRQFGVCATIILLSTASYFTVSHFLLETVQVAGRSMVPTLQENDQYILNRWVLRDRGPSRQEIVVIKDPADKGFSVKRIIAMEGESIHIKNGKVFVNGIELHEPYLAPETRTFTYSQKKEQLILCGKGQYFVLGDNREASIDSRSYGPITRESIQGLVVVK